MLQAFEHAGTAYELRPWPRASGSPLEPAAIRRLFAVLTRDAKRKGELRALLAAQSSGRLVSRLSDDQVARQLAARVAARRLYVYAEPVRRYSYALELPEPMEEVLGPLPVKELEDPVDEPIDTAAQVSALVRAARDGLPFCEECEKARLAREQSEPQPASEPLESVDAPAQAAALRAAAASGAPFCAECEKAKKAGAAGAAQQGA